jgi:NAD+ diphosphatase
MQKLLSAPKLSAQTGLNRRSEKRADRAFIAGALAAPRTKALALSDLKVPVISSPDRKAAQIRWFTVQEIEPFVQPNEFVFLGEDMTGACIFACNLLPWQLAARAAPFDELTQFVDLRSLALQGALDETDLLLAAQARAILGWHGVNRCCGRCGARLRSLEGGWRRQCGACGLDVYPRTDPAVIMLITHGNRCLLGHEHRFRDKMYSALAGFVEAGDDIEHAVRREVKEETGVEVGEVRYVASQPWPFPHNLMIGCWGEALTTEIVLDPAEIADARWFSREEAVAMLNGCHPDELTVPPAISMAHTLLRAFVDGVFDRP